MKKNYVQKDVYSSTDWHDMATDREWLKEKDKGTFEIADPLTFIAKDIYNAIEELVDKTYTVDAIRKILEEKKNTVIETVVEEMVQTGENEYTENPATINITFDEEGFPVVAYDYSSGYTHEVFYYVQEIEADNVAYIVPEHIINPGKGCDLIERLYHEMFTSLSDALSYQEKMMESYKSASRSDSGYRIEVIDAEKMKENAWYKDNIAFVSLAKKLNLSAEQMEKYRYMNGYDALSELQKNFYKESPVERKMAIDTTVFKRIEKYVPFSCKKVCANAILCDSFTREMCDKALLLALIDAKDQETLDAIHKDLGTYECRVSELTRDLAKTHRGHGFTVISKAGEIRYYENGFGISSWEDANILGNKYFGKFHYNYGNEMECFSKYNPDAFVDEFPSVALVDNWEARYRDAVSAGNNVFA